MSWAEHLPECVPRHNAAGWTCAPGCIVKPPEPHRCACEYPCACDREAKVKAANRLLEDTTRELMAAVERVSRLDALLRRTVELAAWHRERGALLVAHDLALYRHAEEIRAELGL